MSNQENKIQTQPVIAATHTGPLHMQTERIERLEDVRKYIDDIDFSKIKHKMTHRKHGHNWSEEKADYVEQQYKNWLYLRRKYEDEKLPPSVDIDDFWHFHILDTRAYYHDTARIFGYYFHHFPYFEFQNEKEYQALLQEYDNTLRRYKEEYGESIYKFEDEDEDEEDDDERP